MLKEAVTRADLASEHITLGTRGEINVRIPLTPTPDDEWGRYFVQPVTPHFPMNSMRGINLRIVNGAIEYTTSKHNFEKALDDIKQRVAGTNTWYFTEHVPMVEERKRATEEQERATEAELDAIRKKFQGK